MNTETVQLFTLPLRLTTSHNTSKLHPNPGGDGEWGQIHIRGQKEDIVEALMYTKFAKLQTTLQSLKNEGIYTDAYT